MFAIVSSVVASPHAEALYMSQAFNYLRGAAQVPGEEATGRSGRPKAPSPSVRPRCEDRERRCVGSRVGPGREVHRDQSGSRV